MKIILLAFIISLSIHFALFSNYENTKVEQEKKEVKTEKKSNITYVKIKPKEIKKEKTKVFEKPTAINKPKIKNKPVKKVVKKTINKPKNKKITENTKRKSIKKITKPTLQDKILKDQIVNPKNSIQQKTLENFLSQKDPVDKEVLSEIEKLYGREFETFTKVQKAFLQENLKSFKAITQRVLNRLGYPNLAAKLRLSGTNTVEFTFYPDGSIKHLKITDSSGYEVFDKYSIELIEIAYKDYPKPKTATKLKFNVQYRIVY